MALPYFFVEAIGEDRVVLDEATSKHVVGVLRMERNEELLLTDGKGLKARAAIIDDNRKRCVVAIGERQHEARLAPKVIVGISLVKNAARFEWFLEKATEIGVTEILPLLCARTEKEKFRADRLQGILQSAMLQSQQCWMPVLHEPIAFAGALQVVAGQRFIAHCEEGSKVELTVQLQPHTDRFLLIGPEGDFTPAEIAAALSAGFLPATLGATRLRTETAGMVGAAILRNL
ncbi:RsmE family RNA methyltransferase [Flaviaesturariibacter amylovorans]|uniref:Ribosomal RNA small subunit methyltransferase E n=1 Tax=Flaviaesturariibacter amylovorans TaxID=1084520 RepID=A0ABP8H9M8_9BACT